MKKIMSLLKLPTLLLLLLFFTMAKPVELYSKRGIFLEGFDPVTYITLNKAIKGSKQYSYLYLGVEIYFSSLETKTAFIKKPDLYIPQYNGWCAYAMADSGDLVSINPKSFKVVSGKIYLFYDGFWGNTLSKWNNKVEASQIQKAQKNWVKHL